MQRFRHFFILLFCFLFIFVIIFCTSSFANNKGYYYLGDVNQDDKVDITDQLKILRHIYSSKSDNHKEWVLSNINFINADINQDETVDITDILLNLRFIAANKSDEIAQKHPDWKLLCKKTPILDEPSEPDTPSDEPSEPSIPSDEPSEPDTPSDEPSEPDTPSDEPSEPDTPSDEPSEPDTPSDEPSEPDTPSDEPSEPDTPSDEPSEPSIPDDPSMPVNLYVSSSGNDENNGLSPTSAKRSIDSAKLLARNYSR